MLALACKRMLSCEARALLALVFAAALVVYVLTVQVPDAAASPRTVDAACRVLPSSRADAAYACTSVGVDACVSAGDSYACTATEARGNAMSPWSCSGAVAPSVAAADGREANGTSCAPGAGGTRPLECGGGTWCCDTNRPDGPCAWDRFSTNIQRRTACLVVYNATLVAVARALATNATWLALFSNQFGTDGDAAAASVVAARGTTLPCYWSDAADATLLGTPPSPRTPRAGVVVGTVFLALASAASILALCAPPCLASSRVTPPPARPLPACPLPARPLPARPPSARPPSARINEEPAIDGRAAAIASVPEHGVDQRPLLCIDVE